MGWGCGQGGCERRIELIVKMEKKSGWGSGGGVGWEGQCGCEIEVIVKMKKKVGGGPVRDGGGGGGGQGGCERRIAKKVGGGMRTLLQNMSEKVKIFKQRLLKKKSN